MYIFVSKLIKGLCSLDPEVRRLSSVQTVAQSVVGLTDLCPSEEGRRYCSESAMQGQLSMSFRPEEPEVKMSFQHITLKVSTLINILIN